MARSAVLAGVITAVDTIVIQRVVVVAAALTAAVGWGTAGAGLEKAGQVDMLPDNGQHKHPAVLTELVMTAAVVTIVVECVVDDALKTVVVEGDGLDRDEVVETGLDTNLKQPKGLIIFPSSSILLSLNLIQNFH